MQPFESFVCARIGADVPSTFIWFVSLKSGWIAVHFLTSPKEFVQKRNNFQAISVCAADALTDNRLTDCVCGCLWSSATILWRFFSHIEHLKHSTFHLLVQFIRTKPYSLLALFYRISFVFRFINISASVFFVGESVKNDSYFLLHFIPRKFLVKMPAIFSSAHDEHSMRSRGRYKSNNKSILSHKTLENVCWPEPNHTKHRIEINDFHVHPIVGDWPASRW